MKFELYEMEIDICRLKYEMNRLFLVYLLHYSTYCAYSMLKINSSSVLKKYKKKTRILGSIFKNWDVYVFLHNITPTYKTFKCSWISFHRTNTNSINITSNTNDQFTLTSKNIRVENHIAFNTQTDFFINKIKYKS